MRFADHNVTHPRAQSYVRAAAAEDGAAARSGERATHFRYGPHVLALLAETYGRWGRRALAWWRSLAKHAAKHDANFAHHGIFAGSALLQRWWAHLSVALQRSNVNALSEAFGVPRPSWQPECPRAPAAWELLCGRWSADGCGSEQW